MSITNTDGTQLWADMAPTGAVFFVKRRPPLSKP